MAYRPAATKRSRSQQSSNIRVPQVKNTYQKRECTDEEDACGLTKICEDCLRVITKCCACNRLSWPRRNIFHKNKDRLFIETLLHGLTLGVVGTSGVQTTREVMEKLQLHKKDTQFVDRGEVRLDPCITCSKDKPYCTTCGQVFWQDPPEYSADRCNEFTGLVSVLEELVSDTEQWSNKDLADMIRKYCPSI